MKNTAKRYLIKVPKHVSLYYSEKYKSLILQGFLKKVLFKLQTKILINKKAKVLKVTREPFTILSQNKKKRLKIIQGTVTANLKQVINEITTISIRKLKLVGIGYKCFLVKLSDKIFLNLKLGYSHNLFFKIPDEVKIYSLKANTNIYISSNSYNYTSQLAALLRSYKTPEPYKGKGILYSNEQIKLKEGKKL